jgi:hypothetical protein
MAFLARLQIAQPSSGLRRESFRIGAGFKVRPIFLLVRSVTAGYSPSCCDHRMKTALAAIMRINACPTHIRIPPIL